MRNVALTLVATLALAGCATVKEVPVIEYRTKIVEIPVLVSCVTEETRPVRVVPIRQRYTREEWEALEPDQRAALLTANNAARLKYENEAEIIITGCIALDPAGP